MLINNHLCTTHINELLLLCVRHLGKTVVFPSQITLQTSEGIHHHPFHLSALRPGAGRGEAQPSDTAARPHPGRQHVAFIELTRMDLEQRYEWKQLQHFHVSM